MLAAAKRNGEALAQFEKALQINPHSADACANLAVVLAALDRHDAAVAYFRRAIALSPDLAQAHLYIGLIRLALPHARIIDARRDPFDTCLSSFTKLFAGELPFAYDLGELGRYYRAYERLMAHWHATLPEGAILKVQYEELVADFAPQAQRIVEYCGLEWDDACLAFYDTPRRVQTLSNYEVRRPIYQSSVGRWKPYEPWLGPLIEALNGR